MNPAVYAVKIEKPISREIFDFLLKHIREDKKSRILRQKIKQNADEMLIGEILLMFALRENFNIPFVEQKIIEDDYGKPYLLNHPQIHFNISHSKGYVSCVVSDRPVGIDVQKITVYNNAVAKRICLDKEHQQILDCSDKDSEFTKMWTKKEAALKMYGTGISRGDIKNCLENVKIKCEREDDFWITVCTPK